MNKYSLDNGDLISVPDGEYVRVDALLNYLIIEKNYYDDPSPYGGNDYYTRCSAKADILEDIIFVIKRN